MSDQGTSAHNQVGTGIRQGFVDHKVFLLPSEGSRHLVDVLVEVLTNVYRSLVQRGDALQQGRLMVEALSAVRDKNSRNAERLTEAGLHDECRRAGIPGCVSAGFEGRTDAAMGERARIRLLLDQCV